MAQLGGVYASNGKFFAKIDIREGGARFYMEGPRREDEQRATQDLTDIRAAASGEATRLDGLREMKLAAKRLQEEANMESMVGVRTRSTSTLEGCKDIWQNFFLA